MPIVNQTINVKYEIRQGTSTGAVVYAENHTLTTNQFGLFTAEIGGGTPIIGTFPGIAWGISPFYLFVEVDGDPMGVTQLLSVPYALYAKESANGPAGLPGKNSLSLSTPYSGPSCINGGIQVDAGLDDNNDGTLQPLEIDYTYIICNGTNGLPGTNGINGVDGVSIDSTINNNDGTFSIYYSNGTSFTTSDLTGPAGTSGTTYFAGNGISLSGDTITNLGDLDNNPTNEIQILSVSNDTIFLSNGGFAPLPSAGGFWTQLGNTIHNNNPGNVGIGTTTPIHQLSVASNDSVVASFLGTDPNVSAILVGNVNASAATGIVFFNGIDTTSFIFLTPTNNALTIRNNSLNGNIQISTDSIIVNQGLILVNQAQNSIYNAADTIYNYSPSGTIVHANQGLFLTDSLYVLGNNAANFNWILANDGFGQAKWTDPSAIVGSVGDNWGLQTVVTDTSLFGNGAGIPLSVNPNIIPTQTSQLTNNSGFITSPNDADTSVTNEIELPATAIANQVLTWDGSAWIAQNAGSGADNWGSQVVVTDTTLIGTGIVGTPLSVNPNIIPTQTSQLTNNSGFITSPNDADFDPNNEIQTLSLVGDTLSISGGNSVNLNTLLGTDNDTSATNELQAISKIGSIVTLSNGGGSFTDDVNDADFNPTNEIQNLSVLGNNINISGGGTSTTISSTAPALNQVLTWDGANWTAQNSALGTDNQDLSLAGNTLSLTNDGTPVNLTPFMDNTDAQTLSFVSPNLSILGGNTVNLSALTGPTYTAGTGINLAGNIITNTAPNQIVGLAGAGTTSIGGAYPNFTITSTEIDGSVSNELITSFGVNGTSDSLVIVEAGNTWNVPLTSFSAASKWTENAGNLYPTTLTNNVGIGTSTPSTKLHIVDSVSLRPEVLLETFAGNFKIGYRYKTALAEWSMGQGEATGQQFRISDIQTGTTPFVIEQGSGNVGIGTTSPESMLHVALPNTANHKAFQLGHGNQPTLEWLFKVDEFSLFSIANENNGTEFTAMVIDANNGNIGIGTTIANSKLDVQNADNNVNAFSSIHSGINAHAGYFKINNAANNLNAVNATTNGAGAAINASNTYAGANAIRDGIYVTVIGAGGPITTNKAGYFSASGAANNYAAIFDQGNVGIGTGSPSAKLHLEGSLRLNNLSGTAPAIGSVLTSIDAAGNAEWAPPSGAANAWNLTGNAGTNATTNFIGTTDNVALNFRINNQIAGRIDSAAANSFFGFLAGASTTGNNNTAIGYQSFLSNTSGTYNTAIGADALKLNNTGNQNTAIGAASLQNNTGNNNTATGYATLQNNTGSWNTATGHSALLSNTTGNSNTANGFEALQNNTTGNQNTAVGQTSLYSNTTGSYNTALGHYALANNTTAGMNTAIGKSALYTQAYSNGGTPWESDNVAIGYEALYTNNPTSTINGNSNTAVGNFALRNNTTGNNNTANGYNTLYTNTIGSSNTANGMYALYANSTGDNNTAIGYQSLWSNTSGTANTAVGLNALRMNSIGVQNTAIGVAALGFSTGSYNTATGYSALQNNTGTYNTANGHSTLSSNTSGNNNTATGMGALVANTIGSDNTADGRYALSSNIDGNFNVATGNNALYSNTSGGRNTAIGQYALYLNSTGNFNTALGDNALTNTTGGNNTGIGQFSGSNNTTGSSNTFLGKSADATVNNLTNATAVGANAVVSQSNSLILGNASNVGIGTSTPTAKLDVNGTIVISGANTNELNRAQTGTANLVPIAYGSVGAGAAITNAGTGNWTVVAGGAGQYTITVTGETFVGNSHVMSGTMNGTYGFISLIAFTNNILVQTTNTGGANQNAAFSFIVYKP